MFHMRLCREASHRWLRSAVVKPMLRAEGNGAIPGHDVCCYCMRVHFYTALITDCEHRQTCLFCCVVYTEAWLAPQTHVCPPPLSPTTHIYTHTHTLCFVVVKVSILDSAAGCTCQLNESLEFYVHSFSHLWISENRTSSQTGNIYWH